MKRCGQHGILATAGFGERLLRRKDLNDPVAAKVVAQQQSALVISK